jgi:hypothetical protein
MSGAPALLRHVRQLVSDEMAALSSLGCILPCAEYHIPSQRVSPGLDGARGLRSPAIGVDPDIAQVVPQPAFHRLADSRA